MLTSGILAPWVLPDHSRGGIAKYGRYVPKWMFDHSEWIVDVFGDNTLDLIRSWRKACSPKAFKRRIHRKFETLHRPFSFAELEPPVEPDGSIRNAASTTREAGPTIRKASGLGSETDQADSELNNGRSIAKGHDTTDEARGSLDLPLHRDSHPSSMYSHHGHAPSLDEAQDQPTLDPAPSTDPTQIIVNATSSMGLHAPCNESDLYISTGSGSEISVEPPPYDHKYVAMCCKAENHVGAVDETLFCLKRFREPRVPRASTHTSTTKALQDGNAHTVQDDGSMFSPAVDHIQKDWGCFEDLDEAVALLAAQERKLRGTDEGRKAPLMQVRTVFAGSDHLVPADASQWFANLWKGHEDWADFSAKTDHTSIHKTVMVQNLHHFMEEVTDGWYSDGEDWDEADADD